MSFVALAWATSSKVARSADKLVLMGLADRHNTEHELAYPSLAWICEFSSLDRKTVVTALDRLEVSGFIADSGQRVGKTKQVKAYRLNINNPEIGTVKTELLADKDAVFSGEQSQKRDTEPVTEPGSEAKASSPREWLKGKGWIDFGLMRKKMRNVPFEQGAQDRLIARIEGLIAEGHCPELLLGKAVENGWRTVYPGDDTKAFAGTVTEWTPERRAAHLAKLANDEHPPDPRMASNVTRLIGSVGRA